MMRAVLIAGVFLLALIAWLRAGRQITLLLDRVIPMPAASLAVSPLAYNGGFVIGGVDLTFGTTDHLRAAIDVSTDPANRAVLSWGHDSFILGPRRGRPDSSGRVDFVFDADPGDELSFTRRQSVVSWPTPFQMSVMGTAAPWWKRYVYYRLSWKKRSGATLEMRWRYEREYYSKRGWTPPLMMWNWHTGLLSTVIRPESVGMEGSVVRYIARTKGWQRRDYRMENRGASDDGRSVVVAVVYREDERCKAPGAGKSVELWVDAGSGEVTKELGGQ